MKIISRFGMVLIALFAIGLLVSGCTEKTSVADTGADEVARSTVDNTAQTTDQTVEGADIVSSEEVDIGSMY